MRANASPPPLWRLPAPLVEARPAGCPGELAPLPFLPASSRPGSPSSVAALSTPVSTPQSPPVDSNSNRTTQTASTLSSGLTLAQPAPSLPARIQSFCFVAFMIEYHISSYPVKQLFKHQNPAGSWSGVPGRTSERDDLKLPRPEGNSKARTGVRSPKERLNWKTHETKIELTY